MKLAYPNEFFAKCTSKFMIKWYLLEWNFFCPSGQNICEKVNYFLQVPLLPALMVTFDQGKPVKERANSLLLPVLNNAWPNMEKK